MKNIPYFEYKAFPHFRISFEMLLDTLVSILIHALKIPCKFIKIVLSRYKSSIISHNYCLHELKCTGLSRALMTL